jgi:hypothetical protein
LRALRKVGMRLAVTPTWLASKCGASRSSTLRTFHTTASASKALPSWNFTPLRSLKIHLVLSAASTAHSVARPGISTEGLSALLRSHAVSASYMVRPVKRLPSKPWSGWPNVRGMSAAVIAMRRVVCAWAVPASKPRPIAAPIKVRIFMRGCSKKTLTGKGFATKVPRCVRLANRRDLDDKQETAPLSPKK